MSDAASYLRLVERDGQTMRLLANAARGDGKRDVSDWLVTMHFYVLCIYVKALGASVGRPFQDHMAIRQWLNTEKDLLALAKDYRKVEEWSRDARYEGRLFSREEFHRFAAWFTRVRDGLLGLLSGQQHVLPVVAPVEP